MHLNEELADACNAVDEEELILLAQRFNTVKDQLDEARLQLVDRAQEQEALDAALTEGERLHALLEGACDALADEKELNRKLQDELDEVHVSGGSGRERSRSFTRSPIKGGNTSIAEDASASSLANELAGFHEQETEKAAHETAMTALKAEMVQLQGEMATMETSWKEQCVAVVAAQKQLAIADACTATAIAERGEWEGKAAQLESRVTHSEQVAIERQTSHELAHAASKHEVTALITRLSEQEIELDVSRGVVARVRAELKTKVAQLEASAVAKEDTHNAAIHDLETKLESVQSEHDGSKTALEALQASSREAVSKLGAEMAADHATAQEQQEKSRSELAATAEKLASMTAKLEQSHKGVSDTDAKYKVLEGKLEEMKRDAERDVHELTVKRDNAIEAEVAMATTVEELEERIRQIGIAHTATKAKLKEAEGDATRTLHASASIKSEALLEKEALEKELHRARSVTDQLDAKHLAVQQGLRDRIAKISLESTERADRCTRLEADALAHDTEKLGLRNQLEDFQSRQTSTMDAEEKNSSELAAAHAIISELNGKVDALGTELKAAQATSDLSGRELASALTEVARTGNAMEEQATQIRELKVKSQSKDDALRQSELEITRESDRGNGLEADLVTACGEAALLRAAADHAANAAEEQATASKMQISESERAARDILRLSEELEDAQRSIAALYDQSREKGAELKLGLEAINAATRKTHEFKERCAALQTEKELMQMELKSRAQAEVDQAEAERKVMDWSVERAELVQKTREVEVKFARCSSDLQKMEHDRDKQRAECIRFTSLIEDAGKNIKEHVAAGIGSAKEIERLRDALVHAEAAGRKAREWVENAEASHAAARAKIIERADKEIRRQSDLVTKAKADAAALTERLGETGGALNLVPMYSSLDRIYNNIVLLAKARRLTSIENWVLPPLPPTEQTAGTEGTILLGWARVLEGAVGVVVDSVMGSAPPRARAEATPTRAERAPFEPPATDDYDATGSVARLLSAVKRFHTAEELGQQLVRGSGATAGKPPVEESATRNSLFREGEATMENIGEARQAEQMDPFSQLSTEEYMELHRDWKRLKSKVQDLSTQLRSAKAAIAVGRFREETQRVYIRNRDRLVSRILLKPANTSRTKRLLQMLQHTGM
jgi:chromosome segregation ATPase